MIPADSTGTDNAGDNPDLLRRPRVSSETVDARPIDVQRTLSYTSDVLTRRYVWLAVLLLAVCWALLLYDPGTRARIEPWIGVVIGIGWLLYAMIRQFIPEPPTLMLTPSGMIWRHVSRNLIPWHVIEDITATDHAVWFRGEKSTLQNVTVVWVPRRFYNRKIFVQSLLWRGPSWDNSFIHKETSTGIVIMHHLLSVKPEPLREEIEARWQAFKDVKVGAVPQVGRVLPQARATPVAARRKMMTNAAPHEVLADDKVAMSDSIKWIALSLLFALASYAFYFVVSSERSSRYDDALAGLEASRASFAARDAEDRVRRDTERWGHSEPGSMPPQTSAPAAGHIQVVTALVSIDDGRNFLSAGADGAVKLWDAGTARVLRDVGRHQDGLFAETVRIVHVLPGGTEVLTADNEGRIALRALADGKVLHLFDATSYGELSSLAVSADGRRALSVHPRGNLIVWNLEARSQVKNLSNVGMQTAALSADGALAITGGYDGALWLWDVDAGTILRSVGGHSCCAHTVQFMPGDRQAVSGGGDFKVRLWDVASGEELRSFSGHTGLVSVLAVSDDGKRILSGSFDGTVRIWDVETARELARHVTGSRVTAVAFAADGAILVGGDEHGAIRSWYSDGRPPRDFAGGVQ